MTKQHPITPPIELVQQWFLGAKAMPVDQWVTDVATQAARWGSDQELEACCDWLMSQSPVDGIRRSQRLCVARRPKSPSLKEQALGALYAIATGADDTREFHQDLETIKHALEALPDAD